jgi:lambda repressor-like predicted transcriptional regulator
VDPIDIRYHLKRAGVSTSKLAAQCGVSQRFMDMVISGKARTPWAREAVADAIGFSVEQVWSSPVSDGAATSTQEAKSAP